MEKELQKGDLVIIDKMIPEWHWMKIYEGKMGIIVKVREFNYSTNIMVHVYLFEYQEVFYFLGDHIRCLEEE